VTRPPIMCLCGSSRFIEHFAIIAWELEKEGAIVLGLHYLPPSYPGVPEDHLAEHEGIAARMDELHLRKIDLADRVLVLNIGGYYGTSTRREIAYAQSQGKPVAFLEKSMRWRKKPVVIDAVQWTGDMPAVRAMVGNDVPLPTYGEGYDGAIRITTLEGDHRCDKGDWIIRGVKGELYPCKPDIFALTYEPAE
jgi:hypothetical protein